MGTILAVMRKQNTFKVPPKREINKGVDKFIEKLEKFLTKLMNIY